jgi:hypothetical protein
MLSSNPVFVVGVFPRGPSLFCSILNQNPRLAVRYEYDVWNFASWFVLLETLVLTLGRIRLDFKKTGHHVK